MNGLKLILVEMKIRFGTLITSGRQINEVNKLN